jgi:hypothetical protein
LGVLKLAEETTKIEKKENPFISLLLSLIIPILILKKASAPEVLGPLMAMGVALLFPLLNGLYEMKRAKKFGLVPILGVANVLLTGGIVLIGAGGIWFAVKEALIPSLIALALYVSHRLGKPLVKTMFFNDQLIQVQKVDEALAASGKQDIFEQELSRATYLIVISFVISAILNFGFAYYMVTGVPGSAEFNDQIANMQGVSFVAILVCCSSLMLYAMYRLGQQLRTLTGLSWEDILKSH